MYCSETTSDPQLSSLSLTAAEMSSFNPFTNRRKKQEEKLQEATSQRYGDQSLAAYEQSQQLASE